MWLSLGKQLVYINWASTRENLSSGVCEQHRRRPACAFAQSDQRLCYSIFGKYHAYSCYRWNFNCLAILCSWGQRFQSRLFGNAEDRFSCDEAQLEYYCVVHCFKQEKGQKPVSTALLAIQKLIQHRFIRYFIFQRDQISHSEKNKGRLNYAFEANVEPWKQLTSLL